MATQIESLPPSCAALYKTLEHEGPLTQSELVAASRLSARTASEALGRLRRKGLVAVEPVSGDARKSEYRLSERAR